jgi:uncharacterized membrane protein YraQ (UPF0718 family)/copper chaperone CopZ
MVEYFRQILLFYLEVAPYIMLGLFFVAFLRRYISKEYIASQLGSNSWLAAVKGAILGVPLPLCSCGVVPSAVYFSRSGASKSSVISFLISTPQTGIESIIATYGALGPVFALFRPLAAFVSGVVGGIISTFFSNEKIEDGSGTCNDGSCSITEANKPTTKEALKYAFIEFLDDISIHFIAGVSIAALISVFIPNDFFARYNIESGFSAMAIMIVIGIPMYVCATASIPIAIAFLVKGVSPGAVFVFLAVGPLTNAASLTILYRVLKTKMLAVYIITGTLFAVLFGLLLDVVFSKLYIDPNTMRAEPHIHGSSGIFGWLLSGTLGILLAASIYRKLSKKKSKDNVTMENNPNRVSIQGMTCNHCKAAVTNAIQNVEGVESVEVSLERGEAHFTGKADIESVKLAVINSGYSVE